MILGYDYQDCDDSTYYLPTPKSQDLTNRTFADWTLAKRGTPIKEGPHLDFCMT